MKRLWGLLGIVLITFILSGCESSAVLKAGGYKMIHMNNPECFGSSASGVLLVHEDSEEVVKADIAHKTGYCEAVTGQVISAGGEMAGKIAVSKGLKKSGDSNKTINSNMSANDNVIIPQDEPEEFFPE